MIYDIENKVDIGISIVLTATNMLWFIKHDRPRLCKRFTYIEAFIMRYKIIYK